MIKNCVRMNTRIPRLVFIVPFHTFRYYFWENFSCSNFTNAGVRLKVFALGNFTTCFQVRSPEKDSCMFLYLLSNICDNFVFILITLYELYLLLKLIVRLFYIRISKIKGNHVENKIMSYHIVNIGRAKVVHFLS